MLSVLQEYSSQDPTPKIRNIIRPLILKSILLERRNENNILIARKKHPKLCLKLESEHSERCAKNASLYATIGKFKSFSRYDLKVSLSAWKIKRRLLPKASDALKKLQNFRAKRSLSSLQVTLHYNFPSHQEFEGLSMGLERLKLLSILHLRFQNMPMDDINFRNVSQGLKNLWQLAKLTLDFGSCSKMTDTGIDYLSQGLYNLQSLSSLFINIPSRGIGPSNIQGTAMKNLGIALAHLKRLKKLKLEFPGWVHDEGLGHLSATLKESRALSHLSLNFSSSKGITNKGTEDLSKAIKQIATLFHLNLNFSNCPNVEDQTLSFLSEAVRTSSLNTFALDIGPITGTGVSDLFKEYEGTNLSSTLKVLSLNVSAPPRIQESIFQHSQ